MSKKYEISTEAQVLLKLLRIALGTEPMAADGRAMGADGKRAAVEGATVSEGSTPVEPFPSDIDWREVIRLSYEQKVSSLAVDGLKASGYDPREGKSGQQLEELNAVLAHWFDDVKNNEESYAYYLTVLSTLCQIFSANGLKPVILKGYGLSRDYPIPSHRGAGDIDIYLLDENGNPAAAKGDDILENQLGLTLLYPEEKDQHHSQFDFKGIHIENHHELVSTYFEKTSDDTLRQSLFEILKPEREREESQIFFPSATFNAVYLLQHLYAHFYFGMMNLRQFTDLASFLNRHHSEINWQEFSSIIEAGGLMHFSKGINGILKNYFSKDTLLQIEIDETLANRLVHDIFNFGTKGKRGIRNLNLYFKDRWHYKYFGNKNWFSLTTKHILKKIFS